MTLKSARRPGAHQLQAIQVRDGHAAPATRWAPDEVAVALVHDGGTTAVMMATPCDIRDLAVGFSLTEGIIQSTADMARFEIVETPLGLEARMWLVGSRSGQLAARRRRIAGPTGCGLCGVDSLREATRELPPVGRGLRLAASDIQAGLAGLSDAQALGAATRAAHAAAWWTAEEGAALVREDVGRHNALDKLAGALTLAGPHGPRGPGAVFLTSRVSIEMVQKAVMIGAQAIVAMSAPTVLAVQIAEQAGVTLVGVARDDGFTIFSHAERIDGVGQTVAERGVQTRPAQ